MTTTSTTSRHDPDLLRSEVSQARGRVAQLRKELRQARAEVASAKRGVDTLTELVFIYNTTYIFHAHENKIQIHTQYLIH